MITFNHPGQNENAQKPVNTKLSSVFNSRGWENRTPTKGFGDPYHTIWPIPYKVYYTYFQNYIHVDISLRINFLRCRLSFVLQRVTSQLRCSVSFASQMSVFSRYHSGMQAFLTSRATTVARLSFWSSPHPISSSQLHTLLCFHPCPINLVVFKGVYSFRMGYLISRGASRLDAFSVYPFRTWLPGRRLGSLTGTPAVRPSRSSRTKDSSSQISYAHAG